MSGIEVAGLVFGVVPVVVEILKSYSTAKSRLATFAKHAVVAGDIQLRFQVAAANFNNDCRLLLQATVAHPSDVSQMIEDPAHGNWQTQKEEIEQRLRSLLQEDFEVCQNIVTRLRDILRETQTNLAKLEEGLGNTKQPAHEFARKIWHAFNTSRKENEYVRQLDSLDKWNKRLSKIRKQRCKIQKRQREVPPAACIIRKAVPRSYRQIRVASELLGESLHDSWSCTNESHSGHQAKLSLDARSGPQDVQLDVVVACQPKLNNAPRIPSLEVPIWLQIRSITPVTTLKGPSLTTSALVDSLSPRFEQKPSISVGKIQAKVPKTKKRVRIDDPKDANRHVRTPEPSNTATPEAKSFLMLDLKTTKSVCCHVSKLRSSTSPCQDGCMGYLEVSKNLPTTRFIFYDASKLAAKDSRSLISRKEATSIRTLVQHLRILQQITLAHKLAEAVLQYHSTSWLPHAWSLDDVAYFTDMTRSDNGDISYALESLHLSNRFPDHEPPNVKSKQEAMDLKHTYGIRNLTLAKLGVALLEICTQKSFTRSHLDPTPREIIDARKLLDERPPSIMTLGKRYLGIVHKCMNCDFSCEDDLDSDALQDAVYTEVVHALNDERMKWKKFFGV